jgi:hypothetical protein
VLEHAALRVRVSPVHQHGNTHRDVQPTAIDCLAPANTFDVYVQTPDADGRATARDAMDGRRGGRKRPLCLVGEDENPIVINLVSDDEDDGVIDLVSDDDSDRDRRSIAGPAATGSAAGPAGVVARRVGDADAAGAAGAVRRTVSAHLSADNWEVIMSFLGWRAVVNLSIICRFLRDVARAHTFPATDRFVFGRARPNTQGSWTVVAPPRFWPLRGADIIIAFEMHRSDPRRLQPGWHLAPCIEHATELNLFSFTDQDNFDTEAPYMRSLRRLNARHAHMLHWPSIARFEQIRRTGARRNGLGEAMKEKQPAPLRVVVARQTLSAAAIGPNGLPRLADGLLGSLLLANLEDLHVRMDDSSTRVLVAHCPRLRVLSVEHGGSNPFLRMALYAAVCPTLEYARVSLRSVGMPGQVEETNADVTADQVIAIYRNRPQYLRAHPAWPRTLALRRIALWSHTEHDPQAPLLDLLLDVTPDLREFVMLKAGGADSHARSPHIDILAYRRSLTHMRIVLGDSVSGLARNAAFSPWSQLTHLHVTASFPAGPDDWSLLHMQALRDVTLNITDPAVWAPFEGNFDALLDRLPGTVVALTLIGYNQHSWSAAAGAVCAARGIRVVATERVALLGNIDDRFSWYQLEY